MLALAETSRCTSSAAVSRRRTSAIVMLHEACEKSCRSSFCRAELNEVVPSRFLSTDGGGRPGGGCRKALLGRGRPQAATHSAGMRARLRTRASLPRRASKSELTPTVTFEIAQCSQAAAFPPRTPAD